MRSLARQWRRTPLIPELWRQKQVDLREFEANVVYRMSSRTGRQGYTEKPCLSKGSALLVGNVARFSWFPLYTHRDLGNCGPCQD